MPSFLAVVEGHDLMCDTGLALTRTQGKTKALEDDCTEIRELFDLLDGKWRSDIGKGRVELGSQLREDFGVGQKMNGHYLKILSVFPVSRKLCVRQTHAQNPGCGFRACDRKVLSLLNKTKRFLVFLRQSAVEDFVEYRFGVLSLAMRLPYQFNVFQQLLVSP